LYTKYDCITSYLIRKDLLIYPKNSSMNKKIQASNNENIKKTILSINKIKNANYFYSPHDQWMTNYLVLISNIEISRKFKTNL